DRDVTGVQTCALPIGATRDRHDVRDDSGGTAGCASGATVVAVVVLVPGRTRPTRLPAGNRGALSPGAGPGVRRPSPPPWSRARPGSSPSAAAGRRPELRGRGPPAAPRSAPPPSAL